MSGSHATQKFYFNKTSGSENQDNFFPIQAAEVDCEVSDCSAQSLYAQIGVKRGVDVVTSLCAGCSAYATMQTAHHAMNRALMFMSWDLAQRVIEDDAAWLAVCNLERWKDRRQKPKPGDNEELRCHYIALTIFSDGSAQGNDSASKKGRVVEYFILRDFDEVEILQQLSQPGGVGRVYKLAVATYPKTKKNMRSAGKLTSNSRAVSRRKIDSSGADSTKNKERFDQVAEFDIFEDDASIEDRLVFLPGADERAVFLEMTQGDKFIVTIECAAIEDGRVVLSVTDIHNQAEGF